AVTDDPDQMRRATDAAVAALARADDAAAAGVPSEATDTELAAARQVVDDLARHTRLISACAANREQFAAEFNDQRGFDNRRYYKPLTELCDRHDEALRQFGLDPINGDADEVARAIAASRVRDSLLGILSEWQSQATTLAAGSDPGPRVSAAVARDRLGQVIRSARGLSGGAYARWQDLLDRKDVPGLVAFADSADALSFRSTLAGALGQDLLRAKQYPACRTFLRAAVDRYPHDVWLHYDLCQVCRVMRPPHDAEALQHISAASVQRPDSALFHELLGLCYLRLRSYDQAATALRKAISLSPDMYQAHVLLGCALSESQDWDGAAGAFRAVVRLHPEEPRSTQGLISALASGGHHAEALEFPLVALRRFPGLGEPRSPFRFGAAGDLLSCANGTSPYDPPPAERPAYRKRARDLLIAQLAEIRKLEGADPAFVHHTMQFWLQHFEFASVREPAAERLPPDERDAWKKLWADVRDLRDRTAAAGPPPGAK
ncbi:MAG: tetratricopeptide repeat protein, partial [Zavarzinella sp.]|nr:tetratricopeptide repeat protein [Zavarzinella sp.]